MVSRGTGALSTMLLRKGFVAVLIAVTCVRPAVLDGQDASYILSTHDPVNPWPYCATCYRDLRFDGSPACSRSGNGRR